MRILAVTEFSELATGYGVYCKELLTELKNRGYEIIELACGSNENEPKLANVKWPVIANIPSHSNKKAREAYDSTPLAEFGAWQFEDICTKYHPDIVLLFRDIWFDEFVLRSPLRDYYAVVNMPAVDSDIQNKNWLRCYEKADAVLCYTDWGLNLMKNSGYKIPTYKAAPPSAPKEFVRLPNKDRIKQALNLGDIRIAGMVARNQSRKLFPDLFLAFSEYLKSEPDSNVYLYCHTSYPDRGWEIDEEIAKYGISNRVLFTYICQNCRFIEPSLFRGPASYCIKCGYQNSMVLARGDMSLSNTEMCKIYNLFDLYIQYAKCLDKDTDILTDNGWKKLSEILIGDKVYSHTGDLNDVKNVWKNKLKEKMLEIKCVGDFNSIKCTESHKILALTKNSVCPNYKRSLREYLGKLSKLNKDYPNPEFIEAKLLVSGDIIVNKPICLQDIKDRDISDIIKDISILERGGLPDWHRNLKLEQQFLILQEFLKGNGSYNKLKKCTICSTVNNEFAEQLKNILSRLKIHYECFKHIRSKNRKDSYRFEIYANCLVDFNNLKNNNNKCSRKFNNEYELLKIKSITTIENYTEEFVYDLEIEKDNSYITKLGCVHNCEGYGMPLAEAAACGVPGIAVDFSAMTEVCELIGGQLVPTIGLTQEIETGRKFAIPDNNVLVKYLKDFFGRPYQMQDRDGIIARMNYEKNWNFSNTVQVWEDAIKSVKAKLPWNNKPRMYPVPEKMIDNVDNTNFARWLISEVLHQPELIGGDMELRLIRDLNNGITPGGCGGQYYHEHNGVANHKYEKFTRELAFDIFRNMLAIRNKWEEIRCSR